MFKLVSLTLRPQSCLDEYLKFVSINIYIAMNYTLRITLSVAQKIHYTRVTHLLYILYYRSYISVLNQ